jgi:predicted MPP superfamily phosphohydrolase
MIPFSRYLVAVVLIVALASVAGPHYLAYEASHPTVSVLELEGAPDTMVFIADPHIRRGNLENVKEVIRQVNRLEPSVVLIGGDFVAGDETDLSFQDVWRELDAPAYAVLGNHDYQAGIDGGGVRGGMAWVMEILLRARGIDTARYYANAPDYTFVDELESRLEANGVTVLRNEAAEFSLDGKKVMIVGVDDLWAGRADPPLVTGNTSSVIYIVHEPVVLPSWNADLVLSGHTHGGQFNNALFMLLDTLGIADIQGLHQKGDVPLYVTRGIGTSKFESDLRLFSPPEIVLINPDQGIGSSQTRQ